MGFGGINRGFVDEWRLLVLAEKQEGVAPRREIFRFFFYKGSLGRAKGEGSWRWGMGFSRLSVFLAKGRDRAWRLRGED